MLNDNVRNLILVIMGVFFISLGMAAIFASLYISRPHQIFWLCYMGLILLGIGMIRKDSFLIASQLNILLIPFIFWNIDFFYYLFNNAPLWGLTDYFFSEEFYLAGKIISSQHFLSIPLSFLGLWLIGLKRKDSWKVSLIQVAIVFVSVRLFTPVDANINCVFDRCLELTLGLPYFIEWFTIYGLMIILSSIIINWFLSLNKTI
jgi:hypothetical protein